MITSSDGIPVDEDFEVLIKRGQEAATEIKAGRSWAQWCAIGAVLVEARERIRNMPSGNFGTGRTFNRLMGDFLNKYGFRDVVPDKGARSRLMDCMDNLGAIEAWRAEHLDLKRRLRLNHPDTVLRAFKAHYKDKEDRPLSRQAQKILDLQDQVRELERQLAEGTDTADEDDGVWFADLGDGVTRFYDTEADCQEAIEESGSDDDAKPEWTNQGRWDLDIRRDYMIDEHGEFHDRDWWLSQSKKE